MRDLDDIRRDAALLEATIDKIRRDHEALEAKLADLIGDMSRRFEVSRRLCAVDEPRAPLPVAIVVRR